jgi:hypothetical protein
MNYFPELLAGIKCEHDDTRNAAATDTAGAAHKP